MNKVQTIPTRTGILTPELFDIKSIIKVRVSDVQPDVQHENYE